MRSRKWCFTVNNWVQADVDLLKKTGEDDSCVWMIYGKEKGEAGTRHLQGAIYFKSGKTMSATKKYVGAGAHLEIMKGSFSENKTYCSKENDFTETGVMPMDQQKKGEAEKIRWKTVFDHLESGGDIMEIEDKQILICHYNKLNVIRQKLQIKNTKRLDPDQKEMHWLHGEPGTGKTRAAMDEWPDAYLKGLNKWWDHYEGEETVIIDDVDEEFISKNFALFKQWADIYPFTAEVKGGTLKRIRPLRLVVTSNVSIAECFGLGRERDEKALERRFEQYEYVEGVETIYP